MYLRTLNLEFSAICTQECCISDNYDSKQVELKSYKLISQGKSSSSKGGLIIYLHEKFENHYKVKLNKYKTWEGQMIQVKKRENLIKPIIIGNIYRPPYQLIDSDNDFINELSPILKWLEKKQ